MNFESAFLFFIYYKLKYIVFVCDCCLCRRKTLPLQTDIPCVEFILQINWTELKLSESILRLRSVILAVLAYCYSKFKQFSKLWQVERI